jgi:hypothetical protein
VLLDKMLSSVEVQWLERTIDRILDEFKSKKSFMESSVTSYGESWIFCENILRYDKALASFYLKGPLMKMAMSLLQAERISFLRDQTYYKFDNAESTPWHQDALFIPCDSLSSVTFWVPFHDITSYHSPMSYLRHSHRFCYLGTGFDRYHSHESFAAIAETSGLETVTFDNMTCGQVLAHDGWAMHGSPAMSGSLVRKAIVVVYAKSPIDLSSTSNLASCHSDLRTQAMAIRKGNVESYRQLQSTL